MRELIDKSYMQIELTDRESELNGGLMRKIRVHSTLAGTMKKPDARMHRRPPLTCNQARKKMLNGANNDRRIDMHTARKKTTRRRCLISCKRKKKASSFFIVRVVGSGYAFVITLSGSTCGL